MPDYERLPILFALDAADTLRHVDDVPNGLACGCTCPDPGCGQKLMARNAGTKRIHHFAHARGSCEWSVEHVLVRIALEVVTSVGRIAFPKLEFFDAEAGQNAEISPARMLRVTSASLESIGGRGAPELVVSCAAGGEEKRFAVVISLIHPLKDSDLEKFSSAGFDVVLVDLRASLHARKREAGKHFDRAAIVAGYQDKRFLEHLLLDEGCSFKKWAVNSKRASAEAASMERKRERDAAEENWREACIKRFEALLAAEAAETARLEAIREKEEAERLAEEKAVRDEAERRSRIEIMEQIDQQEYRAIDSLGRRWVKCERCGEVKLADEFWKTGGSGRINLGFCYDCLEG